ncbi:MAG: hypothetical protein V3V14_12500 [Saprospiraceae bacterium]
MYKSLIFIFAITLSAFSSCNHKTTSAIDAPQKEKKVLIEPDIPVEISGEIIDKTSGANADNIVLDGKPDDCHGVRKTISFIENTKGEILMIGDIYVISLNGGTTKYMPCEISKKYQKEGLQVTFGGEVLEIFSNERLIATPFRLSQMVRTVN